MTDSVLGTDYKINETTLAKAGYKRHPAYYKGEYCLGLWQKAVRKGSKKLYFVNFYLWDFTQHPAFTAGCKSASVECRMFTGGNQFDLNYFVDPKDTVQKIEKFYRYAYDRLGCVPDRVNND